MHWDEAELPWRQNEASVVHKVANLADLVSLLLRYAQREEAPNRREVWEAEQIVESNVHAHIKAVAVCGLQSQVSAAKVGKIHLVVWSFVDRFANELLDKLSERRVVAQHLVIELVFRFFLD